MGTRFGTLSACQQLIYADMGMVKHAARVPGRSHPRFLSFSRLCRSTGPTDPPFFSGPNRIWSRKILDGFCRMSFIKAMDFENPALQTILRLPTADRIQAAREIIKSLDQPEDAPLSPKMIALLDAQLEDFHRNPDGGEDWETVRAAIESRL